MQKIDDMEKSIRNWDAFGRIRVGASISIGSALMPAFAKTFAAERPETDLQVRIDRSDRLQEALLSGELDVALIEGIVHDDNLFSEEFMEDSLAVIASPVLDLPEGEIPAELFLRQRQRFLIQFPITTEKQWIWRQTRQRQAIRSADGMSTVKMFPQQTAPSKCRREM